MGQIDIDLLSEEAVRIKVSGEMDLFNVDSVISKVINAIKDKKEVIIDMEQLNFIDSIGLGAIIDISRYVEDNGGKLKLINLQKHILKLFDTTGLNKTISIEDDIKFTDYNDTNLDICDDIVVVEIPAKPIYIGMMRLVMTALAGRYNFGIEAIEDIKVAITEVITNSIAHNDKEKDSIVIHIKYECNTNAMIIKVRDNGPGFTKDEVKERDPEIAGGLGLYIVEALMDEVSIDSNKGKGTVIKMIKYGERK